MHLWSRRSLLLAALLFHAACGDGGPRGESAQAVHVPRECIKDEAWVEALKAETLPDGPPSCATDEDCPCGSYCSDMGPFCVADCVSTEHGTYGCTGAATCDNWGVCFDPTEPPPPTTAPALRVDPPAVSVPPAPGNQEAQIAVMLDHAGTTGPQPTLRIGGTLQRVFECPPGQQTCPNPTPRIVRELEVRCSAEAPWADECALPGPWSWQAGGTGVVASQSIWVRPKANVQATAWELRVLGDDATANDESVTVTIDTAAPQPFEGRYQGQVTFEGRVLDVEAVASAAGELVIIDASRTLSPSGKLRVPAAPHALRYSWLADATGGEMIAQLDVDSRTFDATSGALDATFRITLPIGGDGRPGTRTDAILEAEAHLRRIGANDAPVCDAATSCLAGRTCEPLVGLCLAGPAWQAAAVSKPTNGLWDASFEQWSTAVRSQLTALAITPPSALTPAAPPTPDAIERLACFDPALYPGQELDGVFAPVAMEHSGDLRCASNNSAPWQARTTIRQDAADATLTVEALLAKCITDLEAQPPAAATEAHLPKSDCISLSRLLPGLDLALDASTTNFSSNNTSKARAATLAQEHVRSWLEIAGFTMQQGEDDVGLSGAVSLSGGTDAPPTVTLPRLLDRAEAAWRLLLHAPLTETLASFDPRHLREPDYRAHAFAAMHWPGFENVDRVAGRTLTLATNCGSRGENNSCDALQTEIIDPLEVDLSGDVTLAFRIDLEAHKAFQNNRYIVDSPAISVRLGFDGHAYRERYHTREAPAFTSFSSPNWWSCRSSCASSSQCLAWTYNFWEGNSCKLHNTLGTRKKTGGASGVIALANHGGTPTSSYTYHWLNTRLNGTTLETATVASFAECYDRCYAKSLCVGANYEGSTCTLKSSLGLPLSVAGPQAVIMPTVNLDVSHLTERGQLETVRLKLPNSLLNFDSLGFAHKVVITRNIVDRYYRAYVDGNLISQVRYNSTPGRWKGRVRVGRDDSIVGTVLPQFEAAEEVGLWATALDEFEIKSIYERSTPVGATNYLTRGQLNLVDDVDHDQPLGLPVTMLEALDGYHRLLERQVDDVAGDAYAACTGASYTGSVESALARVGDGLRRSVLVGQFADDLAGRARQVECDSDAQCGAGERCGATARYRVDAQGAYVVRTGVMQGCYGPPEVESPTVPTGLCGAYNGTVSTPGAEGTATFTFQIAEEGDYKLWGEFLGQTNKQSFWVRLDSGPWSLWNVGLSSTNAARWHWSQSTSLGVMHLTAGTHTITLGVREGWTVVDELVLDAMLPSPSPDQRHAVCVRDGAPVERALPWQAALDQARTQATASRERLERRLAEVGACKPPMGITEIDAPLFFRDPPSGSAFDQYFAASDYLLNSGDGLATRAVGTALSSLTEASTALDAARDDEYEQSLDTQAHDTRMDDIRAQYDARLGMLCGPQVTPDGGMLRAIAGDPETNAPPTIDEDACFVVQTASCIANARKPVREAQASCYSGEIGEAVLAMKGTAIDVEGARLEWGARQGDYERKAQFCAELETTHDMIVKHNDHMDKLRRKKKRWDTVVSIVSLGAAIATGGASAAAVWDGGAPDNLEQWGTTLGEAGKFLGAFGAGVSVVADLLGGAAVDLEAEQQKWNEIMQARSAQLDIVACWNEAAAIRDQINLAQNRIQRATLDFELATARMMNARREVARLVKTGTAELARENERRVVRPQHHYWLDEKITSYERKIAHAKRMTYLAVRAIEHDFQQSTGLAPAALEATNPYELDTILMDLHELYDNPLVCGQRPQSGRTVFRLTDLLGIAPGTLGDYLATEDAIIRDANGVAIGRGVRFAFGPNSTAELDAQSSERMWDMTGSVQVDGGFPHTEFPFLLYKRATFFSRWCGDAPAGQDPTYQIGIHRPSQNVFASDENGFGGFQEAAQMQASTISNTVNKSIDDLETGTYLMVDNFAGQGLYGDYIVMFADANIYAPLRHHIEDLLIRFDYVYVVRAPAPGN